MGSRAGDSGTLRITEIYRSIQGEGTRAGMPCVLVRLTGCDLRCRWCDTAYAFSGGRLMAVGEVAAEVDRLGLSLVEVTGGEPLLQPAVHDLMAALLAGGKEVLLETGGHRDISGVAPPVVRIMDLKAPGSGEAGRNLWSNLAHLRPTDEIKIVIADREDYVWARRLVAEHDLFGRCTVLFSPVHDELTPRQIAAWILEDGLPVRLQLQLHKLIWGRDARSV